MTSQPRWMTKTIEAASNCNTPMPWERGARRSEFIARRNHDEADKNKVTLAPVPEWLTQAIRA